MFVEELKVEFVGWNGKKYPVYIIKCPRCGKINVEIYPIRVFICEHCGALSNVPENLQRKMMDYTKEYGDLSNAIPVEKWKKVKRDLLESFKF